MKEKNSKFTMAGQSGDCHERCFYDYREFYRGFMAYQHIYRFYNSYSIYFAHSKKRLNGRRLLLSAVLCAVLEILSFVPSVTMTIEDDFISTAFICLFCYITDFWIFGPFAMPILAVCVAAVSRLKSAKSKVAFAALMLVGAALVILRLRYGHDWMQGIIDFVNSVYERIDPDGGSLS